ncbi:hypothetical protein CH249_12015 [Rhodococcus sp. 05-2255-3B1]|uniref:DUF4097 family beta strand repeat-containing protein n=1 Tax=unclassified Rhodococcus (in: high G+C Gram-positive bacteria) TaxID=192944 RepID=UPI000B9B7117|nr:MULTISPECIES: DUF4097 family beta strand repeat-containing protein [unclassified Rhodococcus (in: high G+C Gram-positive bacteria)]OZE02724.1 hypothetical protein CH250_24745 [Rhodococcus sp. 05-2255-3C]OZE11525.1 hypothetical protein CH249_12015 [Rhodococcus sp. 05-2255-3B1]OZE13250.1 hypothetical protein CH255_25435 [Rhodococcus sp. 05-2255-2A2]
MPEFATPTPIDLAIDLQVGSIDVVATERADTVVTVTPTNPSKAVDRKGAENTKVDFDGERLTVIGPKARISFFGPTESVEVKVELPQGSRLTAEVAAGGLRTVGDLGAVRIKSAMGPVEVDSAEDLWVRAGHGNATVSTALGNIDITADHGQIRLGTVVGDAVLKASHGSIMVRESGTELDAKLSYGDLDVEKSLGGVSAKTAYGSITLHEVTSGAIQVESGYGQVTVGVRRGVPAWLDLSSKDGHVRNELTPEGAPDETEESVTIRARTRYGDIAVRHS